MLAAFVALAAFGRPAAAQGAISFAPSSKIVIQGTSNVHEWSCVTSTFDGAVTAPALPAADAGKALTTLVFTIPVKLLDCGNGGMNGNLQKAMHADDHPTIRYRMTSFVAVPEEGAYKAVIHGVLTINGTDRPTDLHATITPDGSGGATAVGSARVTTTDFGVPIVKLFLGTMRTGAKVTITFRLTASRA
ncbi:MAG: YceI family protein [Gemmatimonadaceae bacterium]